MSQKKLLLPSLVTVSVRRVGYIAHCNGLKDEYRPKTLESAEIKTIPQGSFLHNFKLWFEEARIKYGQMRQEDKDFIERAVR